MADAIVKPTLLLIHLPVPTVKLCGELPSNPKSTGGELLPAKKEAVMSKDRTMKDDQGRTYNVNSDGTLSEKNTSGGIIGALLDNAAATVGALTGQGSSSKGSSSKK